MYKLLSLVFIPTALAGLLKPRGGATIIPNKYIVKFKGSSSFDDLISTEPDFTFKAFNGFAGTLSEAEVAELDDHPDIEYIAHDSKVFLAADLVVQTGAPWGLGRISHVSPYNTTYVYDSAGGSGEGVCVYVLDTGVSVTHPEFEGRAEWLENFTGDGIDTDIDGHGTHVAGTVGSRTYGVAKKTKILSVKVNSGGLGTIGGIDLVVNDAQTRDCPKGFVANLSLGTIDSPPVDEAVAAAVAAGIFVVVSAGNNGEDASNFSPAREPQAFTVGASTINDTLWRSSNYGPVLDIIAPGADILSTWLDNSTLSGSGTSMAAPHVAGLAAYLMGLENLTADTVRARILELSHKDILMDLPESTVNALAFNGVNE
ncbi:secreted protein 2 [Periconia macrospinosa]|uniref:Secreted protein 2 n=1 Tax=Periconia macrospinosa TaxID=97972 RepID=A0A2V1DIP4_9PLEO|nr:secreted protein 2 [Periconia macrospinosa]